MAERFDPEGKRFETIAAHCGFQSPREWTNDPLVLPITQSVVYLLDEPKVPEPGELFYSRWKNPSREALENALAALEGGSYCCTYASGLAAIHTVFQMLRCGDHIVSLENSYSGTWTLLNDVIPRAGIKVTLVDFSDLKNLSAAMRPETRAVFIETPTNPCCALIDIRKVADLVHSTNPKAIVIVDNTFATPYYQKPLALGADVVVHSCTKFIGGHHDLTMGSVITNRKDLYDDLYFLQKSVGAVPSPFECFLCLRSLHTLHLRLRVSGENTQKLAEYLEVHPLVEKVMYPGLASHPDHELAKAQFLNGGFGGMMAFYVRGADVTRTMNAVKAFKVIKSAVSLGGYDTTAQIPYTTSHSWLPKELILRVGVTPNCIRLSVGTENIEDLKADIDQALRRSADS